MGRFYVAVVGPGDCSEDVAEQARVVGQGLGGAGVIVVCGGLGGVMEAACRGAKQAGGLTVGILPGDRRQDANRWVDVALPTGIGEARNALVVRSADVVIAVAGGYGTLSEIALALKAGKRVVGLDTWDIAAVDAAVDAANAVAMALDFLS